MSADDEVPEFRYESWFDAFQASTRQFAAENEDLEAILEGDAGFHAFVHTEGVDVTRGAHTAVYQALYDVLEDLYVDEELVALRWNEVTPETVAEEIISQIADDHGVFLSEHVEAAIRDRVQDRVRTNQRQQDGDAQ